MNKNVIQFLGLGLLLLFILIFSGCTKRAAYDGMRMGAEAQCESVPDAAYADCIENARKGISYEEYEVQRQEVIKDR